MEKEPLSKTTREQYWKACPPSTTAFKEGKSMHHHYMENHTLQLQWSVTEAIARICWHQRGHFKHCQGWNVFNCTDGIVWKRPVTNPQFSQLRAILHVERTVRLSLDPCETVCSNGNLFQLHHANQLRLLHVLEAFVSDPQLLQFRKCNHVEDDHFLFIAAPIVNGNVSNARIQRWQLPWIVMARCETWSAGSRRDIQLTNIYS